MKLLVSFALVVSLSLALSSSGRASLPHGELFTKTLPAAQTFYENYQRSAESSHRSGSRSIDARNSTLKKLFTIYQQKFIIPFAARYSWAIPNEEALRVIQKYGPVLELGAGTGYWASLLEKQGVDVKAYDDFSLASTPGYQMDANNKNLWFQVEHGTEESVLGHSDRTLLLCWPSDLNQMASNAIRLFEGQHVIYIGEPRGGTTGDDLFFHLLDEQFELLESVKIPNWPGYRDKLQVYRRIPFGAAKRGGGCGIQ